MKWLAVFIGGGLGSMLRLAFSQVLPYKGGFPYATFSVNVISSFILGAILCWSFNRNYDNHWFTAFVAIGFCGGFSTFSTFSMELFKLIKAGGFPTAILYVFLSTLIGLLGVFAGYRLFQSVT